MLVFQNFDDNEWLSVDEFDVMTKQLQEIIRRNDEILRQMQEIIEKNAEIIRQNQEIIERNNEIINHFKVKNWINEKEK